MAGTYEGTMRVKAGPLFGLTASLMFFAMVIGYASFAIAGSKGPNTGIAYVTNGGNTDGNGSISLIDIATLQVVGTIPLAGYPVGLALTTNGRSLYVTGYN
jgi:YVTN family beta-propeller protein